MVKCIWKRGILGLEHITLGVWENGTYGIVRDIKVYYWLTHALLVKQGEKSQGLYLIPISLGYYKKLNCYLTFVDC